MATADKLSALDMRGRLRTVTRRRFLSASGIAIAGLAGGPRSNPEIVVTEPRARGSIRSYTIVNAKSETPRIWLRQRISREYQPNRDNSGATPLGNQPATLFCQIEGLYGRQPMFSVPPAGLNTRDLNEIMWRPIGQKRWNRFDMVAGRSGTVKSAQNRLPFEVDEIQVQFRGIPYFLPEYGKLLAQVMAAGHAFRLPSDLAAGPPDFAYGRIEGSRYTDFRNGRTLPDLPLPCFGCRDTDAQPPAGRRKALMVLTSGVHAAEDMGTWMIDAMVQEWLANREARRRFNLHVYPLVNVSGRYTGRSRGTAETAYLGWDCNRQFEDDTANIYEVVRLKEALALDGYGDLHIDGHSHQGHPPYSANFVWSGATTSDVQAAWIRATNAHITLLPVVDQGGSGRETMQTWLERKHGVASFSWETNLNYGDQHALTEDVGRAFMRGAVDVYDKGLRTVQR